MNEGISFNLADARVKLTERSRGRMKIQIKLNKEQAEGFKNFQNIVKPPEMLEDDFILQLFFAGCNSLTADIKAHAEAEMARQEAMDKIEPKAEEESPPVEEGTVSETSEATEE